MKAVINYFFFIITFFSGCSVYTETEYNQNETQTLPFNWMKVGEENGDSLYVDVDNIKKSNGFVFYWELIDFKEAIYGALSRISKFKVNCVKKEKANLDITAYTGQMGKYIIINEGKYPGTLFFDASQSITMKFACDKVK